MKLVSYRISTAIGNFSRIGALSEDSIIDLNLAYARYLAESGKGERLYREATELIPPDMIEFFKRGDQAMDTARRVVEFARGEKKPITGPEGEKVIYKINEVKLMAPIPRPNTMRDTISYEGHIKKFRGDRMPEAWYQMPCYYKGNPCSVIGTGDPILWPSYTEKLDYELEFGIYIRKQGKDIKAADAIDYIAGYTVFNDVSARDIQRREMSVGLGPAKGKDFDNGNVMGPCLVTPDELDVSDLKMTARVNGEVWSEGRTSLMHWSFPQIIEHISQSETLYPGDFIGSGTVTGGCGAELGRWIKPGDVIELEVEGIGSIKNQVFR